MPLSQALWWSRVTFEVLTDHTLQSTITASSDVNTGDHVLPIAMSLGNQRNMASSFRGFSYVSLKWTGDCVEQKCYVCYFQNISDFSKGGKEIMVNAGNWGQGKKT